MWEIGTYIVRSCHKTVIMHTCKDHPLRQITVIEKIHQVAGVTQLEFGMDTVVVGIQQRLKYFGFILICIQMIGRGMPFTPCANEPRLPYENVVTVFSQNRTQLRDMATNLRQIGILPGCCVVV
ncbi:hypothetical protein A7P97_08995 [Eikenella sp. NML070372]|nr:hypothetical protein A7P97_08995 [Eikenella sp. NML070372]